MILINGSEGEGGGQILRTALGLSLVTGVPFRITEIRAARKKPGLLRQHLTAVEAARTIGNAEVHGAELGSSTLSFAPKTVSAGEYRFSIGTAGSTTLVLQAVLPALLQSSSQSRLVLSGGTHNPMAPTFDFVDRAWFRLLRTMGVEISATLHKPGFFPAGGGEFTVEIAGAATLRPLELMERGARVSARATAIVSNLSTDIAKRELAAIKDRLGWPAEDLIIESPRNSVGPGNVLSAELVYENVTEVFSSFGERGLAAETVAKFLLAEVEPYLKSTAAVGPHLADQLLIPLALAGSGRFTTQEPTEHTRTNARIIERFLPVTITLNQQSRDLCLIEVQRRLAP